MAVLNSCSVTNGCSFRSAWRVLIGSSVHKYSTPAIAIAWVCMLQNATQSLGFHIENVCKCDPIKEQYLMDL